MNNDQLLDIVSQVISTALVYAVFKVNDIPWKKWKLIVGAILVALAVNMLTNIFAAVAAPIFQINFFVSLLAVAGLQILIAWPIFSLLRSDGKIFGAAKGFACSFTYAIFSFIYAMISRFVLR